MIKHIVISGGGPTGLISYGALKTLAQNNFWSLDNIKSVYASSIGGFIAICIMLGYNWDDLDDYLIKRPWENAFGSVKTDIMEILYNKGIDGESIFNICMCPLLKGKDLNEDVTLKEFYEFNKIDLHLTAVELNKHKSFELEVLSHKTHPEMKLVKALACTAAFPFLFKPVNVDDKAYLDGGILCNFPLNICLDDEGVESGEVLGLKNQYNDLEHTPITPTTGLIDYARILMYKAHSSLDITSREEYDISNIITFECSDCSDYGKWYQCLGDRELRTSLITRGTSTITEWLSKKEQSENTA